MNQPRDNELNSARAVDASGERMPIEKEKLEELKAQHGDVVHLLEAAREQIAVRAPGRAIYARFRELMLGPRGVMANEQLVSDCLLWPKSGTPELEAIYDRHPGVIDAFANELVRMAGGGVSVDEKKL